MMALVGATSGFVAGMLGMAGGIIIVPALSWAYGPQALHSAIVASWFAVFFNSLGAALAQLRIRSRHERLELLSTMRWYLMGLALTTPAVAYVTGGTPQSPKQLVGGLQVFLAMLMLMPLHRESQWSRLPAAVDASVGGFVGGVSTAIGVGGGAYSTAYFTYGARLAFRDALATANLTGLVIGGLAVSTFVIGLFTHGLDMKALVHGPVSPVGLITLVATGVVATPLGVKASAYVPTKTLRMSIIFLLLVSAGRLLLMPSSSS